MPDESPLLFKAGVQSPDDPFRFVMSSPKPDSYGDIVEQDWNLRRFKRNPIALWQHQSSSPIGTWADVSVVGDKLEGTLKMAAPGSSPLIDMVRTLLEQRVLRAVSVGFRAGSAEPLDPKNPWDGYRLSNNTLLEGSVVSIPANEDAVRKYIGTLDVRTRDALLAQSAGQVCIGGACAQLMRESQSSGTRTKTYSIPQRTTTMSLAQRIKQKQEEIVRLQNTIAEIAEKEGELEDSDQIALEEATAQLDTAKSALATLEAAEQTVGRKASASQQGGADTGKPEKGETRLRIIENKPETFRSLNTIACVLKAYATNRNPIDVAKENFKDMPEMEMLVRASTDPAITTDSTWATNLIQQTWGPFVALLRDRSVYGNVPGMRVNLSEQRNFPVQNGRGSLAAGFVAENGVIPVKEGSIGTTSLLAKKLAAISAFSKELGRRSIPNIASVIQDQLVRDTAEALDTLFLDNTARSTTRPAGLQDTTETGAANINAVTNAATGAHGSTVAEILVDVDGVYSRAEAIKAVMGRWFMNPAQVRGLMNKQEATTGQFIFREELQGGMFYGSPVFASTNVTAGIVAYVTDNAMAFGEEAMPRFEQSDSATLHFENTTPLAIGTAGTPNTVAAPAINLFQQDLLAIKMLWDLDWRILRQAGVQVLTGATGW